eukprot:EG_transcript_10017
MAQQGPTYGSFSSQSTPYEIQVVDDFPRGNVVRRFESFVSNPMYRLFTAALFFASICIATLLLKRDSLPPHLHTVSRAVTNSNVPKSRVGCVVEIGATEGKVILYIPMAPWTVIVAKQEWDTRFDSVLSSSQAPLMGLENAIRSCAREARAYPRHAPFGGVRFVELPEAAKAKIARHIAAGLERSGLSVLQRKAGPEVEESALKTTHLAVTATAVEEATVDAPQKTLNLMSTEEATYQRKHMKREMKRFEKLHKLDPALGRVPAQTSTSSPEPLPEEFLNHRVQVPRR